VPYRQGEQGTCNSEDSDGMMVEALYIILPATGSGAHAQEGEGSGAHAQEGEGSSAVMSKARNARPPCLDVCDSPTSAASTRNLAASASTPRHDTSTPVLCIYTYGQYRCT
jgi:hypothetical protein